MAKSKSDLLREIKKLQGDLNQLEKISTSLTEEQIKLQEKLKGQIVRRAREVKKVNQEEIKNKQIVIDGISEQERGIKSLSGIYGPMSKLEQQRVSSLRESGTQHKKNISSLSTMQSLNEQIANLSANDVIQRESLQSQFNAELDSLDKRGKGIEEQIALMTQTNQLANNYAGLTDKQKQFLEKQRAVLEGIQDTIGGVLDTARLLTSTVGGVLGSALIGAGYAIDKLGQSTREFGGFLGEAQVSATGLSLVFPQALEATKGLSAELGGIEELSFQTQLNTNLMATNMGISGSEAAKLTGAFARLNGGSVETAQNLAASTKEFAKQNGVIPSQVMQDVANSTQAFAEYGKDGGKNIAQAAVMAAKLGVNMSTVTGVTDSLLDFESSITKELELGAMLGRNINLNKARQLAYDGKLGASVKETIKQMGGINAFNKMDVFQKRQAAEAAGMTVEQFQKMAANMDKLNDDGSIQLSKFDTLKETLTGIVTGPLGGMVKGLGSAAIAAGQMGVDVKGMAGKLPGIGKLFNKLPSKGGGGIASTATTAAGGAGGDGVAGKLNKASGGKGMNVMNMVKGAAAILILSAALFVAAKAFQEFGSVTWTSVGMGLTGLAGMAAIAMVLGKVSGQLLQGSIAVAALGLALVPFALSMKMMGDIGIGQFATIAGGLILLSASAAALGFALPFITAGSIAIALLGASLIVFGAGALMAGKGLEVFGGAASMISEMVPQITQMVGLIGPMSVMIPVIAGLAGAFALLGASLGFLGIAGLPGLVVLAGVAALAGPISKLASVLGLGGDESSTETTAVEEGSLSEYQSQMLQKMDMLIQTTAGTRDVYLDKDKVTNVIMDRAERGSGNVFGLGVA
jgi:hypothetical protein|tara:strand:+ start:1579 stop:4158 length:2580 start_codon:yes stop_codon:yes gene_type:complete